MRATAGVLLLAATLTGCGTLQEIASPGPAPPPTRSSPMPTSPPSAPPPPVASPSAPGPPPRVLAPQVEDEQRLRREAQSKIDGTERLVQRIDQKKLVGDHQQNFLAIQSFLVKAKEALSERDVQRAFALADKAYLLANELSRTLR